MREQPNALRVCADCYMAAANGIDDTLTEWPDGFREAWVAAVAREGGRVFDPVTDPDDFVQQWRVSRGVGHGGFSLSPCEWCGSPEKGYRFYGVVPDDPSVTCDGCGGPCDATDSVADDSGLAWCGSLYGNGCADQDGVTA